jgi:16S rRNA processing protein RimM
MARRDQLPETDEGEYYWVDLIGLRVVTDDGAELGTLREIIETGSNDVYVVQGREKEYLIPALADVVSSIDLEAGTMTVTPLDGLLDL